MTEQLQSNQETDEESYKGFQSTGTIKIDPSTAMFNVFFSDGESIIRGEGISYKDALIDAIINIDLYLEENNVEESTHKDF